MALIRVNKAGGATVTKLTSVTGTRVSNDVATFDITSLYADYANLTIDNIAVQFSYAGVASSGGMGVTFNWTYSNGIITCTTTVANAHFFGSDAPVSDIFIFA